MFWFYLANLDFVLLSVFSDNASPCKWKNNQLCRFMLLQWRTFTPFSVVFNSPNLDWGRFMGPLTPRSGHFPASMRIPAPFWARSPGQWLIVCCVICATKCLPTCFNIQTCFPNPFTWKVNKLKSQPNLLSHCPMEEFMFKTALIY